LPFDSAQGDGLIVYLIPIDCTSATLRLRSVTSISDLDQGDGLIVDLFNRVFVQKLLFCVPGFSLLS